MAGRRRPAVAGLFYPADPAECAREVDRCWGAAKAPPPLPGEPVAAVVPHAGWTYSGPTLAAALRVLAPARPETFLLFGAVHSRGVDAPAIDPSAEWETPLGPVAVDGEVARALAEALAGRVVVSGGAHDREHSLEVVAPFLRARFPGARIVPVATPPGRGAAEVGAAAVRAAAAVGRRVVALGSSDLTHYGDRYGFTPRGLGPDAHRWSKEENDRAILDRAMAFDPAGVETSARQRANACGAGAIAAVVEAARALGASRAVLLEHTTSAEVTGEREPSLWVGYGAVAFLRTPLS